MSDTSQQIVYFDSVIRRIVENHPERAVTLLMQEYTLAGDRDSFVAALVGHLVLTTYRSPSLASRQCGAA